MLEYDIEERAFFLGVVKDTHPDSHGSTNAYVVPLYRSDDAGTHWARRLEERDCLHLFPKWGKVIWFHAPPEAERDTLWVFQLLEAPNGGEHPYRFTVDGTNARRACEIIDLLDDGVTSDDIRVGIQTDEFAFQYTTRLVFARVSGSRAVGPIAMVREGEAMVFDTAQPCEAMPVVELPRNVSGSAIVIDGNGVARTFLGPGCQVSRRVGEVDWSPDADVLRRAIKYIKGYAPVGSLRLTDNGIREAVRAYLQSGDGLDLRIQRLQRAASILEKLGEEEGLIRSVRDAILTLPETERIVTREKELVADREVRRVEAMCRTAEEEIARLRQTVDEEVAAHKAAVEAEVMDRRAELERLQRQAEELQNAVQDRVTEMIRQPMAAVAELLVTRSLLQHPALPCAETPTDAARPAHAEVIDDASLLRGLIDDACRRHGCPKEHVRALHAALLADAFPLVTDGSALLAVETYASCVSGGQFHWIPVSPTLLDAAALLGPEGEGSLAAAFMQAEAYPERQFLVLLDGVNRAPIESYLLPLLACYQQRHRGNPPCRLRIAGRAPGAASLRSWPRNLLAVGSLAEGAIVLPVPEAINRFAVSLPKLSHRRALLIDDPASELCTAVATDAWSEWRRRAVLVGSDVLGSGSAHECLERYTAAHREWFGENPPVPGNGDGIVPATDGFDTLVAGSSHGR